MRTDIFHGLLRREFSIPLVRLAMGRNPPACTKGHWFEKNGLCHCGKPVKHSGFYVPWRYGHAELMLGTWRLAKLHVWVNNEGHWGSYYEINLWRRLIIGILSRTDWRESPTGFRIQGPSINWASDWR